MDQKDLHTLIEKCVEGNRVAQKQFFTIYGPFVKGIVWKYFVDPAHVEDAFIEAMYKILTKLDTLEDRDKLMGWMKTVAVNEALMIKRKYKKTSQNLPISEREINLGEEPEYELDKELVLEVLNELPDGYRNVFNLYEIDGFKHREIAEILGISINTSKSQLIMAKKKLREKLSQLGFNPKDY